MNGSDKLISARLQHDIRSQILQQCAILKGAKRTRGRAHSIQQTRRRRAQLPGLCHCRLRLRCQRRCFRLPKRSPKGEITPDINAHLLQQHGSQAELREPTTSCELFVRACIAVASSAADEAAKLQSAMLAYTHFSEECSSKQDALM